MTRGGCLQHDSLECRIEKVCAKDGNGWSKLKPSCPLPWAHRSHQSLAGITGSEPSGLSAAGALDRGVSLRTLGASTVRLGGADLPDHAEYVRLGRQTKARVV